MALPFLMTENAIPVSSACSNTGKKGGLQQKRHEIEDCLEVQ